MEFKIVPSKSTEWIKDFLQPPHYWREFLFEALHWSFFILEKVSYGGGLTAPTIDEV